MSVKTSNIYALDTFDRDDSATVGKGWTTTANLQISNQAVQQISSFSDRALLLREADADPHTGIAEDYEVGCSLVLIDDTTNASGALILRAKDTDATEGYRVRLLVSDDTGAEVATLYIEKMNGGTQQSPTVTELASYTVAAADLNLSSGSSYDNQLQELVATIYDEPGKVKIEVSLNSEESPILSYEDTAYPLWRGKGYYGFEFIDKEGGSAAASKVVLDRIVIRGIADYQSARDVSTGIWDFGKLKSELRSMALRDSSANVDDAFFGRLINEAEQDLARYVRDAWWLIEEYAFKCTPNQVATELPVTVIWVDPVLWDDDNNNQVMLAAPGQFRKQVSLDSTGVPYIARLDGRGPNGGPQIRFYTKPTSARNYRARVMHRPRFLFVDSDIPDTPQEFCHALVWGALFKYSMRDSRRQDLFASQAEWTRLLRDIRSSLRQRAGRAGGDHIQSGLDQPWPGTGLTIYDWARYGVGLR